MSWTRTRLVSLSSEPSRRTPSTESVMCWTTWRGLSSAPTDVIGTRADSPSIRRSVIGLRMRPPALLLLELRVVEILILFRGEVGAVLDQRLAALEVGVAYEDVVVERALLRVLHLLQHRRPLVHDIQHASTPE